MLTAACWFGQLRGFVDDTNGFGQHLRANLRANVIEDFRNGFGGAVHSFFVVSLQNSVAKHQDRDRSLEHADIPTTVIDEVFTAGTAWNPKSLILYDAEDRFVRWQTDFSRAGGGTSHEVTCAEDGGGQWLKNDICLDSLRHYEFKTGTRYDWILRLRTDYVWPLPNEGAGSEANLANMSRTFAAASMLVKAGDLPKQTTPSTPTTSTQVQVSTPPFVEKTLEVLRERLNPTDEDDGLAVPCSYNRATAVTAVTDVDNIATNRRKVAKVGRSAVPHWLFSAFPLATLETLPAFSKENMWNAWAGFITLIEVIGAIVSALYYRPAQPFLLVENTKEGGGKWTAFAKQFLQRFFPQRARENAFFSNSTATFKYLQRKMMPSSRNNVVIDLIITDEDAANIKLPAKTVSYLHSGHKTLEEKRELQVRRYLYVDTEAADGRGRNEGLVGAQLKLLSEKLLPQGDQQRRMCDFKFTKATVKNKGEGYSMATFGFVEPGSATARRA
eukprot:g159.t1